MIYRKFGKTGIKVSQLGFGCMRFPSTNENDPTKIDEKEATHMLHYAIDHGVNYLDTAYPYHREMSERFVGKALHKGYRDKVYFATKMPMWIIRGKNDPQKYFDEQLKRLSTDRIDMYLLHALGENTWKAVNDHDVLSFIDELKSTGKIRYAGFSFHDELPLFKKIVDNYHWDFCLLHINYVDKVYQAGIEGLEYAYNKGLAQVIMEPLRGGKLANNVPREVLQIIRKTKRNQTPAQFALRWLFNRPEISCVLSGMTTLEQVKQNIEFASGKHANTLTPVELHMYEEARNFYLKRTRVLCTQCRYCLPCPQKIAIPFILGLYNDAYMYSAFSDSRWMYNVLVNAENRADHCVSCRECEERCPQNIPIAKILQKAHTVLNDD